MYTSIRPALVVAIAFLLAVSFFGFRFVCTSADLRLYIQEFRRGEELDQFWQAVTRHTKSQENVVRELIAQRCSLNEALASFGELGREFLHESERRWPYYAKELSENFRQALFDENAELQYAHIIGIVKECLMGQPEETAAVLRRLEKEYQWLQAGKQPPSATLPEGTERNR